MNNTLKSLLSLSNYRIESRVIALGIVLGINVLLGTHLLAEIFFDLRGTSLPLVTSFFLLSLLITFFQIKWHNSAVVSITIIVFAFVLLESFFIARPEGFNSIHFWFVLLIMAALILRGMKEAILWYALTVVLFVVNTIYVHSLTGESYTITVRLVPSFITQTIFLSGVFAASLLLYKLLGNAYAEMKKKTEELENLHQQISQKKNRMEQHQQTLLHLSRNESAMTGNLEEMHATICKTAAEQLNVERVSIWWLNKNGSVLSRKHIFCDNPTFEPDLLVEDYKGYFQKLKNKMYVAATNVYTNEDTKILGENFFLPLGIKSMLDCPILLNSVTVGVICCEKQFVEKEWTIEEILFVQSLADFVSLGFQNDRIRRLVTQLRGTNHDLVVKNVANAELNQQLSVANQQMANYNKNLENAVKRRTRELEEQNKQLTEYAFINSHLLRAPVARILGIANMIKKEVKSNEERKLIEAIGDSVVELDEIIRKISTLLVQGEKIERKDVEQKLPK